jgi:DNA-directed RNA polymerase subunit M/transcription elongation factor TFIIS
MEEKQDQHEASMVKCDLCSYKWVAVRPKGLIKLECPNCGNMVHFENIPID